MNTRSLAALFAPVLLSFVAGCSASSGRYFSIREPGGPEIVRAPSDSATVTPDVARNDAETAPAADSSGGHFRMRDDAICMQCGSP